MRKGFSVIHFDRAHDRIQLKAKDLKLQEYAIKKKRKIAVDANKVFADIPKIKAAKDEEQQLQALWEKRDRAAEARNTAEIMLRNEISKF